MTLYAIRICRMIAQAAGATAEADAFQRRIEALETAGVKDEKTLRKLEKKP